MQSQLAAGNLNEIPWTAKLAATHPQTTSDNSVAVTTNIRAVWLIAKADCAAGLAAALNGPLLGFLRSAPGFAGSLVLHAHKEFRSVMVLTFWEQSAQAAQTRWEEFSAVQRLLSPLVDVCTRVQAYEGKMSAPNGRSAFRSNPMNPS